MLDLGLFFYLSFLFYPLRNAHVRVHYLEITIFTPPINIGVLASIIIQVDIHTRLLIKSFLWENINNDTLNTSG